MILGKIEPKSLRDEVLRDLFCEAFDILKASKEYILKWQISPVFPLLRRAYEIISLFVYFVLKPDIIEKWEEGRQINQTEIRDYLSKHPLGESKESQKNMYSWLSRGAHINRDFIAYRGLGRGNEFVLGSIQKPHLLIISDHFSKTLDSWFWLIAVFNAVYSPVFEKTDSSIIDFYFEIADSAKKASKWLEKNWNDLNKMYKQDLSEKGGITPINYND